VSGPTTARTGVAADEGQNKGTGSVTDVFEEVEEQIRQDRYITFFKKWGLWLAVGFGLILAGMAAGILWRNYQEQSRRENSEAFAAIITNLQEGRLDDAKTGLEAFDGRNEGVYRAFSMMAEAAILVEQGDLAGAIEKFDAAAEVSSNPIVRDSARLRAAYLAADTQDFAALETRLVPLLEDQTAGEISAAARELLAIEAWEAGQVDRARDLFDQLALDVNTPDAIRQRAEAMAPAVLGPAAAPETPDTPSPAGTTADTSAAQAPPSAAVPAAATEEGAAQ
jgi:hypothetical protein